MEDRLASPNTRCHGQMRFELARLRMVDHQCRDIYYRWVRDGSL